jgi:hypothetical protein
MLAVSFLQLWMTVVGGIAGEDNPQNQGFLGVVVTAAACAFVAKGRADGMARAMLATAGVQALLAAMLATAPITREPVKIVAVCGVFCLMWLVSAVLFQRSVAIENMTTA